MRARFGLQQQPVKITVREGVAYIFICLNETQGVEKYPDIGEGQTVENYYEYDYNEIVGPEAELPIEDIQAHPENYLEYEYQPQENDPGAVALAGVKELEAAIERGACGMIADALESLIRYAQRKLSEEAKSADDKTMAISCSGLFRSWKRGVYETGDIRVDPDNGYPYECIAPHDSIVNTGDDYTIKNRALWKPYHSRSPQWALWKGIDVSDNQGVIDWTQVAAAGVQFAILRSVRRSGKADYQFAANLAGCRKNNIPVAVYKYTYAVTTAQAQEEARQVVALLQQHNLSTGTMVWWDVEDRNTLQPLGRAKLTALIQAARTVIEAAGYRFGIYVGLYVYSEGWFDFNQFAAAPLWVARYYNNYNVMQFNTAPDQSRKPEVGRALWGWQYTSTGRVPGINGNADLDICYQDPAGMEETGTEAGPIWCLSIADVWSEAIAKAAAVAYPGCLVHKAAVLDVGGIEIWIASIADVWTQAQAEEAQRQFAALGVSGVVHNIRVLE